MPVVIMDAAVGTKTMADTPEQCLTVPHQVTIVCPGFIPFQHAEFFQMAFSSFSFAEAFADLEYFWISGGHQALHAEFRRGLEIPVSGGLGYNKRFRCRGGNEKGGFYLQKIPGGEIIPHRLNDPGTEGKVGGYLLLPGDHWRFFPGRRFGKSNYFLRTR